MTLRVLILSAPIGEGHDLPARVIADELRERGAEARVADGLAAMGPIVERAVHGGAGGRADGADRGYDLSYALFTHVAPLRRLGGALLAGLGGPGLRRLITREAPDVVVSTYPGVTEALGRLRLRRHGRGRLGVPLVSAITDLAALRYWAHPGVDLHLITHPESAAEVRAVAGAGARVVAARGMNDPAFAVPRDREQARAALGLPARGPIVVVSGGGWGVGDLEGAVATALALDDVRVVVMCGHNADRRERLAARFGGDGRVELLGFTTAVPELFAAADVLVHSTAGLTVLEAGVRGCAVISYGWGRGHIRANNRAYERFGLARVARDRGQLAAALRAALAERRAPDAGFAALPSAAELILACAADPPPGGHRRR